MTAELLEAYWAATKGKADDLDVVDPISSHIAKGVFEVLGYDMTIAEANQAARLILTGRKRMKPTRLNAGAEA